jgi:hypothetical protein
MWPVQHIWICRRLSPPHFFAVPASLAFCDLSVCICACAPLPSGCDAPRCAAEPPKSRMDTVPSLFAGAGRFLPQSDSVARAGGLKVFPLVGLARECTPRIAHTGSVPAAPAHPVACRRPAAAPRAHNPATPQSPPNKADDRKGCRLQPLRNAASASMGTAPPGGMPAVAAAASNAALAAVARVAAPRAVGGVPRVG